MRTRLRFVRTAATGGLRKHLLNCSPPSVERDFSEHLGGRNPFRSKSFSILPQPASGKSELLDIHLWLLVNLRSNPTPFHPKANDA